MIYRKNHWIASNKLEAENVHYYFIIQYFLSHPIHIERENLSLSREFFVMSMDGTMRNKFNWIVYADWLAAVYILGTVIVLLSRVRSMFSSQRTKAVQPVPDNFTCYYFCSRRSLFWQRNFTVLCLRIAITTRKDNFLFTPKIMVHVDSAKHNPVDCFIHSMWLCISNIFL